MSPSRRAPSAWPWTAATVALVAVLATRIAVHAEGANGPWYWRWRWYETDPWRASLLMAAGLPCFLAAQWLFARRGRAGLSLALLMASTLAFALANTAIREPDLAVARPVAAIVENHTVTGYLTDARAHDEESAAEAVRRWLREWPERTPGLSLHNRNKPPGATLYFAVMLHWFGESAALVGGLLVGLASLLSVPACYALVRAMRLGADAAFHGASYLALCPGLIVVFPQFDPLYAAFASVLVALWIAAVDRGTPAWALAFGVALTVFTFFTYNLLVLGAFLVAYLAWQVAARALTPRLALRQAGLALLAVATLHALLHVATGYDPVRAFTVAVANQQGLAERLQRPYPATILYDLLDFALGAGYVAAVLALYAATHSREIGAPPGRARALVYLCVGQVFLVAVLGILPTETLRVWGFLLPLLMVPTGLTLAAFPPRARLLLYLCAWAVLTVTSQEMVFMRYRKLKPRPTPSLATVVPPARTPR